ncbi:glycoside hydrolase family 31 protein [Nitrospirillum sp. BR 11828]|uniref:glycoside hydrolase family 31 protein n=1 Tax=Nitrospirillum sp. BR 11828 TaxID=3104325 RepID=UPI002ACA593F|nr:glycoside hydrolase family 31 protein [Nitrospirillum sp. BR 11828]MDZ5646673.1 glycoside hydrolase family 31 protein [Nitrospirillum sp. BR 11828]
MKTRGQPMRGATPKSMRPSWRGLALATRLSVAAVALAASASAASAWAADSGITAPVVVDQSNKTQEQTLVLEPYGPNIIRVTLSLKKDAALAGPGYGIIPGANTAGWTQGRDERGDTVLTSGQMSATVVGWHQAPHAVPPQQTAVDISRYFGGTTNGAHITFKDAAGKTILDFTGWSMGIPNFKDGNSQLLHDRRPTDDQFYTVNGVFAAPADEHYYGLGQNQEGFLDHRGHVVRCWNDYNAPGGQSTCVPFMITNYGYGLLWDNPSKTTIEPGFNEVTRWTSEVGDRVSFFVIAGKTPDEIYAGYRQLTGATPMLPKSAYGYIQSKQRYRSQQEVLDVAKGYRERHIPADVLVVDWFYYTIMGQFDFVPELWPNPKAMNKQLHDMGFETMISVWPRFTSDGRYYDLLKKNGWFLSQADGTPTNGLPYDKAGSDIDTTNPDAAKWYWNTIRDNILSQGFDSLWSDETEPDLPPNGSYYHIGPGTKYFNVYPLFHTSALYDGFRRDFKDKRTVILSRDAYLGVQRNGAIVWSSDITPTWDAFKRQVPTGLDFAASGITYWSNDTGGWQYLPEEHKPAKAPLLDPTPARGVVGGYDDYPELYTRWFQYATFLPVLRTHGSRPANEIWSYGPDAQAILEKYVKLRYQLIPYIYSLGYKTYKTGAPFLRALPLDFPNDPAVTDMRDEYMFGPALLVAPVTEQGATTKQVYLPAGSDWYDFWTDKRYTGGQTVTVSAPIDRIPVFVKAGSILPLGSPIENTHQKQTIAKVKVYPGADGRFTLFQDDGFTYAYEQGGGSVTELTWTEASHSLGHTGAKGWSEPDAKVVEVVQAK